MSYNIELAKKVIESCENPPEGFKYDMSAWGEYHPKCGTVMCLAGWTVYHGDERVRAMVDREENDKDLWEFCHKTLNKVLCCFAIELLLGEDASDKDQETLESIFYLSEEYGDDTFMETADNNAHLQAFKEFFGLI